MRIERQLFLLSYLKTLTDGPVRVKVTTSRMAAWCLSTEPVSHNFDTLYECGLLVDGSDWDHTRNTELV